jgi:phosphatidylethanolamine-binding protein (PEBP) family uncharacterized protein
MNKKVLTTALLSASLLLSSCGAQTNETTKAPAAETTTVATTAAESTAAETTAESSEAESAWAEISNITSEDIKDGKWVDSVACNSIGKNESPQLKWDPVEGAGGYVVYMLDTTVGNEIQWKTTAETNELPHGKDNKRVNYFGPHPDGLNDYQVLVYAVKKVPDKIPGVIHTSQLFFEKFEEKIDDVGDGPGNIIAKGVLEASYETKLG